MPNRVSNNPIFTSESVMRSDRHVCAASSSKFTLRLSLIASFREEIKREKFNLQTKLSSGTFYFFFMSIVLLFKQMFDYHCAIFPQGAVAKSSFA